MEGIHTIECGATGRDTLLLWLMQFVFNKSEREQKILCYDCHVDAESESS
jgi:hypothetical protein